MKNFKELKESAKRALASLLVLGTLGCAPTLKALPNMKFNSEFYFLSNNFYINNNINKNPEHNKHYVVEATKETGENSIEGLLDKDLEEVWLYIKGTTEDKRKVERWYEIGEISTRDEVTNIHNPEKIIADFKDIDEFSHYHIHPIDKNDLNPNASASDSPSTNDILAFFKTRNIINNYGKGKIKNLDFRIITPVGTYILMPPTNLTDSGADVLSHYEEQRLRYMIGEISLENVIETLRDGGFTVELKENKLSKALNK